MLDLWILSTTGVPREFHFFDQHSTIPTFFNRYYDEIKNPMDFGTINQRLNQNKYETMEEVQRDVQLVFSNCRQFNPPTTYPCNCADIVEQAFNKEWSRLMEKKLDGGDKRSMLTIVNQLLREDM